MSHPATLLKRYLTELNERIVKLDAKSNGGMQTVSETISKLDQKLDGNVQTTNEALSKLDSKLDGDMQTVRETISKLDQKLDGNVQTTNQAIGDLYREKLSVQEFREFVNVFNKILGESFPLPEEPVPQTSEPALRESRAEDNSGFQGGTTAVLEPESDAPQKTETASSSQAVEEVTPKIIVESPPSEADEKTLPRTITVGEGVNKHFGFPMKVVGESFYVGDGATSIVGDAEIPSGTAVDEILVVKGNFRSHECCRLLNNVKALKDIEIGEENVIVKDNLSSKSSIVLSKSAQVLRAINVAKGILRPRAGQRV